MAVPAAAERIEAPGPAPVAPTPRRLMSPSGYVVVALIMIITAVVVYFVTRGFHDAGARPAIPVYQEIDLGQFSRDLGPDATGVVRDPFAIKVVLLVDPNSRTLIEKRRNTLKDIVLIEVIFAKSEAELRNPGIFESLRKELHQRLNAELAGSNDGQEAIHKVIFPDVRLPIHR